MRLKFEVEFWLYTVKQCKKYIPIKTIRYGTGIIDRVKLDLEVTLETRILLTSYTCMYPNGAKRSRERCDGLSGCIGREQLPLIFITTRECDI